MISPAPISVILPVFNGKPFVRRALESIRRQTIAPSEIVVVDDASTDGTPDIVTEWSRSSTSPPLILHLLSSNRGQPAALNHGVRRAVHPFLAFLDADDEWLPNKLERQLGALQADPTLDGVFGYAEPIDTRNHSTTRLETLPARLPSALLARASTLVRVGDFDESRPIGSVIDWCSRAEALALQLPVLPDTVYRRYIHGSNLGLTTRAPQRAYLDVVRRHLQRKSSANGAP